MKIMICGKGGSGKSTISVLLAHGLTQLGCKVLVIDGDESNLSLHRLMGVDAPTHLMDYLGGKKAFKSSLNKISLDGSIIPGFSGAHGINDIPESCISSGNDFKLMVIGKIHHHSEGCACAMGVLSKKILPFVKLKPKEVILVDGEAGVEHFGRGVDAACDMILGVIDPTFESFVMAERMQKMALEAERDIFFILNKVEDDVETAMLNRFETNLIVGKIPKSKQIFLESLNGKPLGGTLEEVTQIADFIQSRME